MGDIVKSIGSVLSPIAKVAGPIASLIPGVGKIAGPLLSILGSAGQGQHAQSQANQQVGQTQDIANQQLANFQQLSQAYPALMQQAGIGSGGAFDPGYNPYAVGANSIYGDDAAIASRADSLYSPTALSPQIIAARSAASPNYNNAVDSYQSGQLGRGFTQGDSNTDANIAHIREQEAASNAGYARDLYGQQQAQRTGYITDQTNAREGLLSNGLGVRTNTLGNLGSLAPGSAQGALGTIGGLQGFYQNQSNAVQQGQGDLLKAGAATGGLGSLGNLLNLSKLFRKNGQSQSPGTTNAQSPTAPLYQPGETPDGSYA